MVFPVGLLVRNGADGRRAGVPSLHPPHSRDGIISMNRGMDPVWSGLVLGVSPQSRFEQRAGWLYFCAVLIEMRARDLR